MTNDAVAPLSDPQLVDEAISARLDGVLDAWALEHGLDAAHVARVLDTRPEHAARARALESVRAHLQAGPSPALDTLTRRRLVHEAMSATRVAPHRTRAWLMSGAAAAVLVVVGAVVVANNGGEQHETASKTAGTPKAAASAKDLGDLGDVSDPSALRDRLAAEVGSAKRSVQGSAAADAHGDEPAPASTTTAPSTLLSSPSTAPVPTPSSAEAAAAENTDAARLAQRCARKTAEGSRVSFVGYGTFRGQPVAVIGVPRDQRTVVFTVDLEDCSILAGQSF